MSIPSNPDTLPALRAGRDAATHGLIPRAVGLFIFILLFTKELFMANLVMARTVLFQRISDLAPEFIDYDVAGLTPLELVILTHCITLTPGTTSVQLDEVRGYLVLHALDARDPDAVRLGIKNSLENPILRWTR
jgi:multisubunit Na+/H+ antiporter MnhE subunit